MSAGQTRIAEAQNKAAALREPKQEPVRQPEQGPVPAVAPQVAYRRAQVNPKRLTAADLLVIQCTAGNRQMQRLLAERRRTSNQTDLLQCDGRTRNPTPPTPAALAAAAARRMSPLGSTDLNRFGRILITNDQIGAVRFIARIMERRGEIEAALMTTQAVRGHVQSECHNTGAYVIDSGVNGPANTISCGCYTGRGRLIPNPRVRVNFGMLQALALTTPHQNQYHENLAELLHSTLLHEFRHVLQYYAGCNVAGSHGQGICSDCNDPKEMDAYLAEIEAGYRPAIYRHAWVRVFVNWDYLAPTQQAVFSARQTAARRKINTAFPGVDWAADAEVVRYQGWCRTLDTRVGGNSRGACNDPMAPVGTARSVQPGSRVR